MRLAALAALCIAVPAAAQEPRWTPAPVPNVGAGDTVLPAARAGRSTDPDHSAPFSGIPTGSAAAGGATSSNETNSVGTPSLSR